MYNIWIKTTKYSIISLVVGIITWFIAYKTVPQIAPILSIAIFFFTEFLLMIRNLLSSWEIVLNRMSEIQKKMEEAVGLWQVAANDPCLNKALHEILTDYDNILKQNDPFLLKQMQDKMEATKEAIRKMSLREIKDRPMDDKNLEYINHLFEIADAHTRVLSTTYDEATEWWITPEGQLYWQYNVMALEKGVKIERIFIIDEKKGLNQDPELIKLMEKHLTNKPPFKVRIATIDSVNEKLAKNMIIFINKTSHSYVVWVEPSTNKTIGKWNLSGIPSVVHLYENMYDKIRSVSKEYNLDKKNIF